MALSPRIELRQKLGTRLSPQQHQALWLLRLSPGDLDSELARLSAANPMLIHQPLRAPQVAAPYAETTEALAERAPSLVVSVARQLQAMRLPSDVLRAALDLLMDLRDDGYLDLDVRQIEAGSARAQALAALQACDPPGVGATSLAECLFLQLRAHGLPGAQAQAMVDCLPLFARNDTAALRAALGLDAVTLDQRIALMKRLRHAPHDPALDDARTAYAHPDLRLEHGASGTLSIRLVREPRHHLRLNERMIETARARGFGLDLIAQAQNLMAALENRSATLVRLGCWLVEKHGEAMAHGGVGAAPATRAMAARELSLHPSTVGRAVADKAVDIGGRVYPLGAFFSAAASTQSPDFSGLFVQRRMGELIASEPSDAPLSDHDITTILKAEGVDIARRTVAKYRQGLGIPIASKRRRARD